MQKDQGPEILQPATKPEIFPPSPPEFEPYEETSHPLKPDVSEK